MTASSRDSAPASTDSRCPASRKSMLSSPKQHRDRRPRLRARSRPRAGEVIGGHHRLGPRRFRCSRHRTLCMICSRRCSRSCGWDRDRRSAAAVLVRSDRFDHESLFLGTRRPRIPARQRLELNRDPSARKATRTVPGRERRQPRRQHQPAARAPDGISPVPARGARKLAPISGELGADHAVGSPYPRAHQRCSA